MFQWSTRAREHDGANRLRTPEPGAESLPVLPPLACAHFIRGVVAGAALGDSSATRDAPRLNTMCNGLQSKNLRPAINAYLGQDYLPLPSSPGPHYVPLSLQSCRWACNPRWWAHIICHSSASLSSARASWRSVPVSDGFRPWHGGGSQHQKQPY